MPSTTPWAIPYPDGPTNLTALQSHFANIANAVNTALTNGLGGAPRLANSDAERLTLFPAPVQGNSVARPDKGWVEQYYQAYNASTNPGGRITAGWYPISGTTGHYTSFTYNGANVDSVTQFPPLVLDTANSTDTTQVIPYTSGGQSGFEFPLPGTYYIQATISLGAAVGARSFIQIDADASTQRVRSSISSGEDTLGATAIIRTMTAGVRVPLAFYKSNGNLGTNAVKTSVTRLG